MEGLINMGIYTIYIMCGILAISIIIWFINSLQTFRLMKVCRSDNKWLAWMPVIGIRYMGMGFALNLCVPSIDSRIMLVVGLLQLVAFIPYLDIIYVTAGIAVLARVVLLVMNLYLIYKLSKEVKLNFIAVVLIWILVPFFGEALAIGKVRKAIKKAIDV